MKNLLYVLMAIVIAGSISCSRSMSQYNREIDDAEKMMQSNADSAISILEAIDPAELSVDSIRAKYHYLKAYGHINQDRSMVGDSLISFAHNYYQEKDVVRAMRSGIAFAWYKFWNRDVTGAIAMLDSLVSLNNVPDSLLVQALRARVLLGVSEYQGRQLIPLAKRLVSLETDSSKKIEAKYALLSFYEFAEEMDSALYLTESLIDYARNNGLGEKHFLFELERAQILAETGRNKESDEVINDIFRKSSPDNGAADCLHMFYAINALNSGNLQRATHKLAVADSFAVKLRNNDDEPYYRSYSNLLNTIIDFKQTGRVKLRHVNGLINRQREYLNQLKASQWETERSALQQHNRALALKVESEHKTVIILIISIVAILLLTGAAWIIRIRRQRERENEERIEAMQKMVDEYKSASTASQSDHTDLPAMRRAMLQQLGIIKMVAETPTEQNREMLRKISSIDGETNGELVNWQNVYELIDNLYSNFHRKLHDRYGDVLSNKEEQIIVLLIAGFSTKEISVITGQTTSTVYVRKSSIRKKLGVPEKEDILVFLRTELA
ncbi:MAG: helix-turn-helix transcriptional regulator [Muribaculaceae bacterium]|nr:helix-turn-helix transcriptional regulator [Muribaculaceae bacterium]